MTISSLCTMMARRCSISSCRVAALEMSKASSSVSATRSYSTSSSCIRSKSVTHTKILSSFSKYRPQSIISSSFSSLSFNPLSRLNNFNSFIQSATPSSSVISIQSRTMASKKHKRIIKMAKGYRGRAKNTFRAAIRRVEKGLQYASILIFLLF